MSMKKLLVVDDEKHICELVRAYFSDDFEVIAVFDGNSAVEIFSRESFDLVILDIMLPGIDGWEICRYVRSKGDTPIIMLTAKDEDIDKILGLELGADDYVTKPFNPRELLARAKAVLRRFGGSNKQNATGIIEYPGIRINNATHQVLVCGQEIELTPKEYDVLSFFANNSGLVLSREQLIQKVWGFDFLGETRTIDSTIKRLRRKLEAVPEAPCFITTVWGIGYKFEVPKS